MTDWRKGRRYGVHWRRRFWAKVEWRFTGCWEWTAARQANGYGVFDGAPRSTRYVHRIAWEILFGPIPAGLVIDHLCRNRLCVNPAHLEPVTTIGRNLRRGRRATATVCKHGHALTPENTYVYDKRRQCRTCRRERVRMR